jgi:RNA polymerase sigma-70 factor, ECF subfamily
VKRPKETGVGGSRDLVTPEIVEACRAGDEQAWATLVQATYREVYSLCFRILGNVEDASEATQDAFVKAWKGLSGFRGDAQFTTWLYRIAVNAAISKQRSRSRRQRHEQGAEDEVLARIPAAGSTETAAGARIDVRALEAALTRLPEHYRDAVVLRDVYGMSIAEIAKQLKISETAAKVRVHRGRKRLKEMMFQPDRNEE